MGCYFSLKIPEYVQVNSIKELEKYNFHNNKTLKHIVILCDIKNPNLKYYKSDLNFIKSNTFLGCTSLKRIEIQGVDHLESKIFEGCTNLTHIVFLSNCYKCNEDTFYGIDNVKIIVSNDFHMIRFFNGKLKGLKNIQIIRHPPLHLHLHNSHQNHLVNQLNQ